MGGTVVTQVDVSHNMCGLKQLGDVEGCVCVVCVCFVYSCTA